MNPTQPADNAVTDPPAPLWAAPLRSEAFAEDIAEFVASPPLVEPEQGRWMMAVVPLVVMMAGAAAATLPPIG